MSSVSKDLPILATKRYFYPKKPPTKIESFQMTLFDLNQTWERVFTEKY